MDPGYEPEPAKSLWPSWVVLTNSLLYVAAIGCVIAGWVRVIDRAEIAGPLWIVIGLLLVILAQLRRLRYDLSDRQDQTA